MKLNKITVFLTVLLSIAFLNGCSDDDKLSAPNRVSFESAQLKMSIAADETVSKTIKVYTSNITSTDRIFDIIVDTDPLPADSEHTTAAEGSYVVPTKVTIPANTNVGEFTVDITATDLGTGKELVLNLVPQGGGLSVGAPIVIQLKELCTLTTVRLDLVLDQYGTETSWELYDSNLTLIASDGPFTDGAAAGDQALAPVDFCLGPGEYTYVVYDAYGDGFCCDYGNGRYTLSKVNADGTLSALTTGTGEFTDFDTRTFTVE